MNRYRALGQRLIAVMGLVACDKDRPPNEPKPVVAPIAKDAAIADAMIEPVDNYHPAPPPDKLCGIPKKQVKGVLACAPKAEISNEGITEWANFVVEDKDGTCCYAPVPFHWRGRALRGPHGVALAELAERGDWANASALAIEAIPEADRAALADVWLRDAAFEHASVASFARLSLELLALGAPPDLVADAHRAALDEIEHARISYGIASALTGCAHGPAPLAAALHAAPVELADLVRSCLRDGCYGETVAVMLAHAARDASSDPALVEAYERIAVDEQRHAELAFRIVAWALREHPELGDVIASERDALAATTIDDSNQTFDLAAYGVLSASGEAAVRNRTVVETVLPAVDALLSARS